MGVWGHAPPGNFEKIEARRWDLVAFQPLYASFFYKLLNSYLLNNDSFVVPDTVPEVENFSQQLVVHLGIKSQSNAQLETVTNINISIDHRSYADWNRS